MQNFSEKLECRESPRTPACTREDNIKMDIRETGCEGVDWNEVAQDDA
jgi:hypothetical protein